MAWQTPWRNQDGVKSQLKFGMLGMRHQPPLRGIDDARLLMRLYERIYSARILETPLREEVVKQIEIGLTEFGIGSMGELSEGDPEEDQGQRHHVLWPQGIRSTGRPKA